MTQTTRVLVALASNLVGSCDRHAAWHSHAFLKALHLPAEHRRARALLRALSAHPVLRGHLFLRVPLLLFLRLFLRLSLRRCLALFSWTGEAYYVHW